MKKDLCGFSERKKTHSTTFPLLHPFLTNTLTDSKISCAEKRVNKIEKKRRGRMERSVYGTVGKVTAPVDKISVGI